MIEKLAVSVEESGKLMGVSRQVAYKLSRRADFPTLRIGRRVLVPRKQLEEWIAHQVTSAGVNSDQAD